MSENKPLSKLNEDPSVIDALLNLAEAIADHTGLETLLQRVAKLICETFSCQICLLLLWDENRACFDAAAGHRVSNGLEYQIYDSPIFPRDAPFLEQLTRLRETLVIKIDGRELSPSLRRLLTKSLNVRTSALDNAVVALPLLHQNRLIGCMLILTEQARMGPQAEAHIIGIARHTALAIASARAAEAEHRRRRDLEALQENIALLTMELEIDVLCQRIAERAALTFTPSRAALYLWNHEHETAGSLAPTAVYSALTQPHQHPSLSKSMVQAWLRLHPDWSPFVVFDNEQLEKSDSIIGQPGKTTTLIIPLHQGDRILGLIQLDMASTSAWYDKDAMALAHAFAHQASVALENAQLYSTLQTERERLRALSTRLTAAQEAERTRIARELHDEAGQALTTVRLQLDYLASTLPPGVPDHVRIQVKDAQNLVGHTLQEIRRISIDLRPSLLDDLGLTPALRWQCDRLSRNSNIVVTLESKEAQRRVSPDIETAVYRAAQEALTNIARHAQASSVNVSLSYQDSFLRLTIADDGKGFTQINDSGSGLGLIGMRERLSAVGGELTIDSHSGLGSTLHIEVPI